MGKFGQGLEAGTRHWSEAKSAEERREARDHLYGEIAKSHLAKPGESRPAGPPETFGQWLGKLVIGTGVLAVLGLTLWGIESYTANRASRRQALAEHQRLAPVLERVKPDYAGFVVPRWSSPTDNDDYLSGFPSVASLESSIEGPTRVDTAVRRMVVCESAARALRQLIGQRRLGASRLTVPERKALEELDKAVIAWRKNAQALASTGVLELLHQSLSYSNSLTRAAWQKTTRPPWRERYFVNWTQIESAPERPLLTAADVRL